jgi:glyoxylase-like metal-dependent hydrolase (beta-lactamase superfamily II)
MTRVLFASTAAAALAATLCSAALAQQPARPQTEVTKVDGTDGVHIWRNGNHQAMFIVTKDGVIATDPIAYGRPTGGQQYVDAIKKITDKSIKYLIYSHHHFDHIAGGKAFKDAGARVIAHKNATKRLKQINDPHTVIPDESVGNKKTIKLGGTTLELHYLGINHSDSTLVMRLPKEKIVFIVDTIPVGTFPGRGFIDIYPLETEAFMERVLKMDWERMIPGHPGQPGGRLGNKKDVEFQLQLMRDASEQMKTMAREGKCWDTAEKEFKLEKYATLAGYANNLQFVARRYCGLWGRGT